jgi:hypothetical protein
MTGFRGHYLVDEAANRKAVVVSISDWEQVVDVVPIGYARCSLPALSGFSES